METIYLGLSFIYDLQFNSIPRPLYSRVEKSEVLFCPQKCELLNQDICYFMQLKYQHR